MILNDLKSELYIIKNKLEEININVHFYIFGSLLRTQNPNDIDLLVLYKIHKDISIIKKYLYRLANNYPLHCLFLTFDEEIEFNFIKEQDVLEII